MNLTLGVIPARGGSKGVPRKNIRPLAGKPLIAWTIEAAKACSDLDRVIVSTDDAEIATIAGQCGVEVPFLRPAALAEDNTPDLPVCQHALDWLAENDGFSPDIVVWLRPTAPLRNAEDISAVIRMLSESDTDCVRSVCAVEHHPYWMYRLEDGCLTPLINNIKIPPTRQQLPPVYRLNGAVDAVRMESVPESGALFQGKMNGYVMSAERSLDIDSEADLRIAELLLKGTVTL